MFYSNITNQNTDLTANQNTAYSSGFHFRSGRKKNRKERKEIQKSKGKKKEREKMSHTEQKQRAV